MQHEATMNITNNSQASTKSVSTALPYLICFLGAMFYLYEFVLQVSPAVMTKELMRDFGLNAAGLGAMTAFYYYAYTPMQLPAGLLYDRFGPRILLTFAILVCAIGALMFGLTHSIAIASASRFLMGVGSAFSFIGALLLVSRWLPPQYFAFIAGIVQLMSSIGAIAGQVPIVAAVATWGWRSTIFWIGIFGILLALLVWLTVRDCPSKMVGVVKKPANDTSELTRLHIVCGSAQTWLIALYSFAVWAPIVAFAALWGIPFLIEAYGISTQLASTACAMIWLGMGIGSPLIGWWSEHLGRRCLPLTISGLIGFVSAMIVIYVPHLSMVETFVSLFFFGLASAGQSLSFGLVKDKNPASVVGTAMGFNNMAVVAGGALFQPLIGVLLHVNWNGMSEKGVPVYNTTDYHWALAIVPLCYLFSALISSLWIKETYCQQHPQA